MYERLLLRREDQASLTFISCDELDGFFLTVKRQRGRSIRREIEALLRIGYEAQGKDAQIFINGNVSGKTIHVIADLSEKNENAAAIAQA